MTVFNWLNEITVKKTPSTQFEKEDWDWLLVGYEERLEKSSAGAG